MSAGSRGPLLGWPAFAPLVYPTVGQPKESSHGSLRAPKKGKQVPIRTFFLNLCLCHLYYCLTGLLKSFKDTEQRVTRWRPLLQLSPLPKTLVSGDFLSHASESSPTLLVGDKLRRLLYSHSPVHQCKKHS